MRKLLGVLLGLGLVSSPMAWAQNLVKNGSFEDVASANGSTAARYDIRPGSNFSLVNWGTSGQSDVVYPVGTADINVPGGGSTMWGPQNGSNNGLTASPDGGNFFGSSAYYGGSVFQDVSGLKVGSTYTLSFWWAIGTTTEAYDESVSGQWQVVLHNTRGYDFAELTPNSTIAARSFGGWVQQVYTFTATSTTDRLSFNTSTASPPMLLLDGVAILEGAGQVPAIPEPNTIAMLAVGGLVLLAHARRRYKTR